MDKSNIGYFEKILDEPPKLFKKWFEAEKKILNDSIEKNSSVLSVGCGDGREIKYLLETTKNIVGIDHDKNAVKKAKKIFRKCKQIKIVRAEAIDLPFKTSSFDYVICMGSFTNFGENKLPALAEMKRVLKQNGKIILSCYSEDAFRYRMKVYNKRGVPILKVKGTTVYFDYKISDCISEQFSEKQLRDIFQKVKLKVIEIKKVGIGYICVLRK